MSEYPFQAHQRSERRSFPGAGSVAELEAFARNSRIIWYAIAAMAIAAIVGFWLTNLSVAWTSVGAILTCTLACLIVSGFYCFVRPDFSIAHGTNCSAQLMLILSLGCVLSYPLAKVGFPYRDDAMNAADVWMGLDWRAYLHFFNSRPHLGNLARLAYDSVLVQLLVLIASLAAPSRLLRLQQYIFATVLALAVTLAVFAFAPGAGTFAFLNVSPGDFANLSPSTTNNQAIYLDALRSGQQTLISNLGGLITFPSFHAAWAILFMWAFYPIRLLRYGVIFLNLFMLVVTPIQGAHYFIDLIGGAIVAAAAIYVAVRLMPDQTWKSPPRNIRFVPETAEAHGP